MGELQHGVVTAKGLDLLARAQAGKANIAFTRFEIGDGTWDADTPRETVIQQTALQSKRMEFPITVDAEYINPATTKLRLIGSNEKNKEGFYITEIGVYAMDGEKEILYAMYTALREKADWMPEFQSATPNSLDYSVFVTVANAEKVTVTINDTEMRREIVAYREQVQQYQQSEAALKKSVDELTAAARQTVAVADETIKEAALSAAGEAAADVRGSAAAAETSAAAAQDEAKAAGQNAGTATAAATAAADSAKAAETSAKSAQSKASSAETQAKTAAESASAANERANAASTSAQNAAEEAGEAKEASKAASNAAQSAEEAALKAASASHCLSVVDGKLCITYNKAK